MWTNIQFAGTLAGNQTERWFTYGWPTAAWHVVWYMMPTCSRLGRRRSTGTSPSSGPTHPIHLLDHGQERDPGSGDLRGPVRRAELIRRSPATHMSRSREPRSACPSPRRCWPTPVVPTPRVRSRRTGRGVGSGEAILPVWPASHARPGAAGTTSGSTRAACSCWGEDPATAPHDQGVLVLDDSGDRKAGTHTAHVARQSLGSVGKTDNGIVAVSSLWADERVYWPAHVIPDTPASRLPKGKSDPGFRTKPSRPPCWCRRPARPGSGSARWSPTASTATTPASPRPSAGPARPSCWRSSPARGCGRRPTRPTPPRGGRRAGLDQPGGAWGLDPGHPPVPRRPHPDLVGGRGEPARGRLGAEPAPAAGGGDHRPREAAEADQLVPGHQPAPSRPPAGIGGVRVGAGRPGRGGGPVRPTQLGRAGLQAGQARARLGRLPGRKRPGDPPPLAAGVLRVLLLLAGLPRRAPGPTGPADPPVDPARSENQGICGTFMRENRESPCPPVRLISGRAAQGTLRRQAWDEWTRAVGSPRSPVVPASPPNKAMAAEAGEERGRAKGNAASRPRPGRSAGSGVSSALGGRPSWTPSAACSRRRGPAAGAWSSSGQPGQPHRA